MLNPRAKPQPSKQPRPVCPAAQRYEAEKSGLANAGLSPVEYARACLRAARKAGL